MLCAPPLLFASLDVREVCREHDERAFALLASPVGYRHDDPNNAAHIIIME